MVLKEGFSNFRPALGFTFVKNGPHRSRLIIVMAEIEILLLIDET